jgi:SecD/SecF fusion protein
LVEQKLFEGLKEFLPTEMTLASFVEQTEDKEIGLMQSYLVGPTIADDIIQGAITSIIIALAGIFLYITIRFRRLNLAIGASLALMHDVIIVLGIFSLFKNVMPFSMEINQAFIAAILTVVGYSINDTVVIFDRIRELITGNKDLKGTINKALNNTLTRTFNTSITIFIVLLAILLFGGESIQGFAFALIIGVVVGTYSSLFIASPVYYDLQLKKEKKKSTEVIEDAVEA